MSRTYRRIVDFSVIEDEGDESQHERKGGKPSKGTPADKRLKDNAGSPPKGGKK